MDSPLARPMRAPTSRSATWRRLPRRSALPARSGPRWPGSRAEGRTGGRLRGGRPGAHGPWAPRQAGHPDHRRQGGAPRRRARSSRRPRGLRKAVRGEPRGSPPRSAERCRSSRRVAVIAVRSVHGARSRSPGPGDYSTTRRRSPRLGAGPRSKEGHGERAPTRPHRHRHEPRHGPACPGPNGGDRDRLLSRPEEVASVIASVSGSDGRYASGATINVDGGMLD